MLSKERNNLLWTVDGLGIPHREDFGLGKYHIDNMFLFQQDPFLSLFQLQVPLLSTWHLWKILILYGFNVSKTKKNKNNWARKMSKPIKMKFIDGK